MKNAKSATRLSVRHSLEGVSGRLTFLWRPHFNANAGSPKTATFVHNTSYYVHRACWETARLYDQHVVTTLAVCDALPREAQLITRLHGLQHSLFAASAFRMDGLTFDTSDPQLQKVVSAAMGIKCK